MSSFRDRVGSANVGVCSVQVEWPERNLRHSWGVTATRWTGQGPPGSCRPFCLVTPSPTQSLCRVPLRCQELPPDSGDAEEEGAAGSGNQQPRPTPRRDLARKTEPPFSPRVGTQLLPSLWLGNYETRASAGCPRDGQSPCPPGHFTPRLARSASGAPLLWGRRRAQPRGPRAMVTHGPPLPHLAGPLRSPGPDPAGADVLRPRRERPARPERPPSQPRGGRADPRVSSLGSRGAGAAWAGNRQPPPRPPRVESKGPGASPRD